MATKPRAGKHSYGIINSVVVLVQKGETREQAWRRHVKKHPEDTFADVRIFHFSFPNTIQNLLIA